jgi:hexosaminidase
MLGLTFGEIWQVIMPWGHSSGLTPLAKSGYRSVNAYGWYLNEQLGWERYYTFDFMDDVDPTLTPAQLALIEGGEACLWTSNFAPGNAGPVLWPGAAAVAERLWSPFLANGTRNVTSATPRLEAQMCRMSRAGHGTASVTSNGFCGACSFVPFELI